MREFDEALAALKPRARCVAAISGGVDSMTMLALLREFARAQPVQIVVAHFNHQLRGEESDADEAFVRESAERAGLEFRAGRGDVRAAARGISIEMAARQLRHAFLAKVAREENADVILAHHADDQVELYLMRKERAIEGPGLAGMRAEAPSSADNAIRLLRPMLGLGRAQIEEFARKNKIAFRQDSSNAELKAERNRIRKRFREQPGLRESMDGEFRRETARYDQLRAAAKLWLKSAESFETLSLELKREVLALQLEARPIPVSAERLELLLTRPGEIIEVSPSLRVSRNRAGRLHVFGPMWREDQVIVDLSLEGSVNFCGARIQWTIQPAAALDPDRIGDRAILRFWRKGDRVRLAGRNSIRPLNELFSRFKISRDERHRLIIATTSEDQIFWVERLGVAQAFTTAHQSGRGLSLERISAY